MKNSQLTQFLQVDSTNFAFTRVGEDRAVVVKHRISVDRHRSETEQLFPVALERVVELVQQLSNGDTSLFARTVPEPAGHTSSEIRHQGHIIIDEKQRKTKLALNVKISIYLIAFQRISSMAIYNSVLILQG